MHELSIAQSIVDIVRQHLQPENGATVTRVRLRIGAMAGVVPESLEFCFTAITDGTPLQSASLEIQRIPLTARCRTCGMDGAIEPTMFVCPYCGGRDLTVLTGNELSVSEIELNEEENVEPDGKQR